MDVLGQIQLNLGHLNSWLNSMDERFDSLVAQLDVDHKVSIGGDYDEP